MRLSVLRFFTAASRAIKRLRFRSKILLGIICIVLASGVVSSLLATRITADAMDGEMRRRGRALARTLAVRAVDPMLALDFLRLTTLVDELKVVSEDAMYAFLLDKDGNVLAHTWKDGFPIDLKTANPVHDDMLQVGMLDTGTQRIYDFAAPVLVAGVPYGEAHVGLSRAITTEAVNNMGAAIFVASSITLAIASLAGLVFSRQVTHRLRVLRRHAEEVFKGNLDLQSGPEHSRGCWDTMGCALKDCPAHGDTRRRCWYLAGTLCPECDPSEFPEKIHSCRHCKVYQDNAGDELQELAETFDVMAVTLKRHIDELKGAEEVLQQQQLRMRTILDATPDRVALLDDHLRYLAVNKAFLEAEAKSLEDVLAKTDAELLADLEDQEEARSRLAEASAALLSGKTLHREAQRTVEGMSQWFHTTHVPVLDSTQKIVGVLRTVRDVTELRHYREQLIQSQKMESVGKLAGGVAHEINTPLGVILGLSQLLKEDALQDSPLFKDLETIERQTKICRKIVADLLGFSRQKESEKQEMCFNNSVMEVVQIVKHTFSLERIDIKTCMDDRMPIIIGDPEKLKQVWMNLMNNALAAMAGGGVLEVGTQLDIPQQQVRAWFADTGSGIKQLELTRIFEPFYTTKPVGEGTGLGLSVSFGIIEDHGGKIWAESPLPQRYQKLQPPKDVSRGSGTVFIVELPLYPAEEQTSVDCESDT